jgi:sensor histidine kinase YesM
VENAIWHGLMHKEGERGLKISFKEEDDFIKCTVEDNGIGRKKAAEKKMAMGQEKKHESKGIEVSRERLKTLRTKNGVEGSIEITDLVDQNGIGCGTKVEIDFPIQN